MRQAAREPSGREPESKPSPVAAESPQFILQLQRTAGNAAVGRLLARDTDSGFEFSDDPLATMPRPSWIPTPGPVRTTFIKTIDDYVEEAKNRSPTARKHIERAQKMGYGFTFYSGKEGTDTSSAAKAIAINPAKLSHDEILLRLMYESGNVVNMDLFDEVRRKNARLEYKTREAFSRAMLEAESITAVYASIKALEAGLSYSTVLDPLVRGATKPDPANPRALTWKTPKDSDRVFKQAADFVYQNAKAQDEKGDWIPARDLYGRRWLHE